jgi:hypothetical protein
VYRRSRTAFTPVVFHLHDSAERERVYSHGGAEISRNPLRKTRRGCILPPESATVDMAVLYSISGSHELPVTYHNGHCDRLEPATHGDPAPPDDPAGSRLVSICKVSGIIASIWWVAIISSSGRNMRLGPDRQRISHRMSVEQHSIRRASRSCSLAHRLLFTRCPESMVTLPSRMQMRRHSRPPARTALVA